MFLTIFSVNSIYSFSELYLSYSLNLLQMNNYFSQVDLENVGDWVSLSNMKQKVLEAHPSPSQTSKM